MLNGIPAARRPEADCAGPPRARSSTRLGEIIASAEEPASEAAATTRAVTAEDIESYGARILDEAIGLLPGVLRKVGFRSPQRRGSA